ncbi:unnamed protein product [Durusdinium trenchii]|uniref:SET domain-containing protein n=1 Tax=Durusdinium trenchii TaxID=1381693 RepID=A0ABP0RNU8_9DINO
MGDGSWVFHHPETRCGKLSSPPCLGLNHSCLPNCEVRIEGKGRPAKMVLCAKKQVKKGQELTIDYIKELAHLEPSERRKLLQQDYGFLCRCPKCLALDRAVATAEEEEET